MSDKKKLGFWMCLSLVIGNTIGMAIFMLPVAMAPLGPNAIWVTSAAENTLTLINPETNLAARVYSVGRGPQGVAVSQDEAWVVMGGEDAVWRIRP